MPSLDSVRSDLVAQASEMLTAKHSPAVQSAFLDLVIELGGHLHQSAEPTLRSFWSVTGQPGEASLLRFATHYLAGTDLFASSVIFLGTPAVTEALLDLPPSRHMAFAIEEACLHPDTPVDLRIACIERLGQSDIPMAKLAQHARALYQQTTSLPLQEALLPFLLVARKQWEIDNDLRLLAKMSLAEASETSRMAVSRTLLASSHCWTEFTKEQQASYLRLLLTLLQDDDVDIRDSASRVASAILPLQDEDISVEAALPGIYAEYCKLHGADTVAHTHTESIGKLIQVN
jgi:hypothetical protein